MDKSGPFDKLDLTKKIEETKKRNSPTTHLINMPLNKKEKRDSQNFNFSYMRSK
jgi:hypothetical protein